MKDVFQGDRFFIPRTGTGINLELQNAEVRKQRLGLQDSVQKRQHKTGNKEDYLSCSL